VQKRDHLTLLAFIDLRPVLRPGVRAVRDGLRLPAVKRRCRTTRACSDVQRVCADNCGVLYFYFGTALTRLGTVVDIGLGTLAIAAAIVGFVFIRRKEEQLASDAKADLESKAGASLKIDVV
jgi:hypothetical protein